MSTTMFAAGDKVERNPQHWPDEDNREFDGGEGNQGTVQRVHTGWNGGEMETVIVEWDHTRGVGMYNSRKLKLVKIMNRLTEVKEVELNKLSEVKKRNLEIYDKMIFSDFIIVCEDDGARFPCHKAIIAAGSAHFARMFESGMAETSKGQVVIEGYQHETVQAFIKFLYFPAVDEEILKKDSDTLLKMADQYNVPKLKEVVVNFMMDFLAKENVLKTVLAAHRYNAPDLKEAAIKFIVKNRLDKARLAEWKVEMEGEADLLFELFSAMM